MAMHRIDENNYNLNSWLAIPTAKHASHALRKAAKARLGLYKARSKYGVVTLQEYEGRKREMFKVYHEQTGIFTPQNKPYVPLGGVDFLGIKKVQEAESDHAVSNDDLSLGNIPVVPLNDLRGIEISLDTFKDKLLKVRVSDANELIIGRSQRVPLSVHIAMRDITGTPDLYVVTDKHVDTMGLPSKAKKLWETKGDLWIHPDDPDYTMGTYYLRICSGIDKCNLKLVIQTVKYIPTIARARLGAGYGYRPSNAQKRTDFGHLIISTALGSASHRRIRGKMGQDPFSGISMSNVMKRPSSSASNSAQPQNWESYRSKSQASLRQDEELDGTLQRALELSCKSSLGHIEFDHNNQISRITVRDFFSVLSRDKEPKSFELFVQRKQKAEEWVHSPVKSPGEKEPLPISPRDVRSPYKRGSTASFDAQGHSLPSFKAAIMELLRAADICRSPLDRFRKPLSDCLTIRAPLALVRGYAVITSDGTKNRTVIVCREGSLFKVTSGCACMVEHGSLIPPGADAVIEFREAKLIHENTVSICAPFSKGTNIEFEERPYFVQNGSFLTAQEYIEANFPNCLREYEALFTTFFKSSKPRHESLHSLSKGKIGEGNTEGNHEGLTTNILSAVDCSDSPIFRILHGAERKKLALAAKLHIAHPETVIARKGEWIKNIGQPSRSLLLLLKGDLRISKCNYKPDAKVIEGTDTILSKTGTVLGENQMFWEERFTVQITAETVCILAEFPLSAFAPLIFNRPSILDGFEWARRESDFRGSQNHHVILGKGGIVDHGLLHDECTRRSLEALSVCEQQEQEARLERFQAFLSCDPLHAMAVDKLWQEERWNDELMELGAVTTEEAAAIMAHRRELQSNESEMEQRVGRLCGGDLVENIRATSPATAYKQAAKDEG